MICKAIIRLYDVIPETISLPDIFAFNLVQAQKKLVDGCRHKYILCWKVTRA